MDKVSHAVSARYDVDCPVCGAPKSQPCRTQNTNRVTDTHRARIDLAWNLDEFKAAEECENPYCDTACHEA